MSRLRRSPVMHFLLVGCLLFAGRVALDGRHRDAPETPAPGARRPIVVSSGRMERLSLDFERRFGARPSPEQLRAVVTETVDQEILYREAKRLALDYEDGSVRLRLLQKMRAVSERPGRAEDDLVREARELGFDDDIVIRRLLAEKMRLLLRQGPAGAVLSDADLHEVLTRNARGFHRPARVSLSHVFLNADTRIGTLDEDAQRIRAALGASATTAERRAALSDAFPLGLELRATPRLGLQARFGKAFADEVYALEPQRWSGPIRSPYGLHFVFVNEVIPAGLPAVSEVRSRLVRITMAERAERNATEGMDRLRDLYEVRVEGDPKLAPAWH